MESVDTIVNQSLEKPVKTHPIIFRAINILEWQSIFELNSKLFFSTLKKNHEYLMRFQKHGNWSQYIDDNLLRVEQSRGRAIVRYDDIDGKLILARSGYFRAIEPFISTVTYLENPYFGGLNWYEHLECIFRRTKARIG